MFDIIPNTLTTALTILFPTFAAYKALSSPPPSHGPASSASAQIALLAPWLQYFTTISLLSTAETYLWPLPSLIPFFAWLRLFAHLYLLLPGPGQGASFIWDGYIAPWIAHHEGQIERVIEDVHTKARGLGLDKLELLWGFVREKVLGGAPPVRPREEDRPRPGVVSGSSYVSGLLGRFAAPVTGLGSVGGASAGQAGDVLGMLGSALSSYASGSSSGSGSGQRSVIPDDVRGEKERRAWVLQQRQRLRGLLEEIDGEAARFGNGEGEYERIDRDEAQGSGDAARRTAGGRTASGGWLSGVWGGKEGQGKSSGADLAYGNEH